MELVSTIALVFGVSWASGVNLYAAVFTLGALGLTGNIVLPDELQTAMNPWVMGLAAILYIVEFVADKIPAVDSLWDAIHTFIRIPAGAALAAVAIGPVDPAVTTVAFLVGGTVSASSHGAKMSTRLAINTSPEPFSNWVASLTEDLAVVVGIYTALHHPVAFLFLFVIFVALVIWLMPKLYRVIISAFIRFHRFLIGESKNEKQKVKL